METWERDEVHSKLAQVGVELTREPQAACDTTHGSRDKMVQVTNCIVTISLSVPTFKIEHKLHHIKSRDIMDSK